MLLVNEEDGILVDISLCTGQAESKDWLVEKRVIVSVIGYLERGRVQVRNVCSMSIVPLVERLAYSYI